MGSCSGWNFVVASVPMIQRERNAKTFSKIEEKNSNAPRSGQEAEEEEEKEEEESEEEVPAAGSRG